jgi:Zinc carboxypeptidase
MKKLLFIFPLVALSASFPEGGALTPFEISEGKATATYDECIQWYKDLDAGSTKLRVVEYAEGTDIGRPMHLVIISNEENINAVSAKRSDKRVLLINNGIHPGEPDGIDASMMLAQDLISEAAFASLLDNIVVIIIPVYNVDGAMNRGCCSRANQNGPENYGFRGNARNLDLNRDFSKCDSRNAQTFNKIFTEWKPDVMVDTHTSDGADYQYTMTYIATQKDKLHPVLSDYMQKAMIPELENQMRIAKFEMCPYVNMPSWGMPPDSGIVGFLETPRFATGYAALFNCIGFTTETHMLKPFADRVWSTYEFLLAMTKTVNRDRVFIGRAKKEADAAVKAQTEFPLQWKLQPQSLSGRINFKGYEAKYKASEVTGMQRMYYDHAAPYQREIPFHNEFKAELPTAKPIAYLIPQAWTEIIMRLKLNGVELKQLAADTEIETECYYIDTYASNDEAYEGHYNHRNTTVRKVTMKKWFHQGDYVVYLNQSANRYLVEMLEPQAPDSWFNWNFFDEILMQKEYFSSYLFEDVAAKLLTEHPDWKTELEQKRQQDTAFAKSSYQQLDFIYKKTAQYEPTHNLYPVGRMMKEVKLGLVK